MSRVDIDAVVVGAGFAGMYTLHRLLQDNFKVRSFEAGDDVGGTWYWNRYPGARCDVQSMEYSYTFDDDLQQAWEWTERYAPQPEILSYANHVADRYELRPHITFGTRVVSAHYNEESSFWILSTDGGETLTSQFLIMATGCLSSMNTPDFKGIDSFKGETYHTGQWPQEGVDFTGKRVGVIGTGSSGIQSIPIIAEEADHLTVFQRTANFSVPAHNQLLDEEFIEDIKATYPEFRANNRQMMAGFGSRNERHEDSVLDADETLIQERLEANWQRGGLGFLGAFGDIVIKKEANASVAEFVRNKIREQVVDPKVAELLCPDQVIGCKRLCVDTNYYKTFNRDDVSLVDVKEHPIDEITEKGVVTNGKEYQFDAIVFATGYDAMTGSLLKVDIRGRKGQTLQDKWAAGPRTYLGLSTYGFPNMFTISGPGSPSVLTNMIVSIEQHVNWIRDCLMYMRSNQHQAIEAELDAEDYWVVLANDIAGQTLFKSCNSWYLGANVPGKPRVFMPFIGGLPTYAEICDDVAQDNYRGFTVE
ncbi:MAG: NAD(P)/FAD-dependent oxidoreductase [Gammaproteobacteria bacterium]|nr:NAD(P)/FAD-dependent oxidoreductase [Gammaproteobacteria bacterium]